MVRARSSTLVGALFFVGIAVFLVPPFLVGAQPQSYTTVATPVVIRGEVEDGDIVSYDAKTGTCHPSQLPADEMMYGVVVTDPVMYLSDPTLEVTDGTPVVRYGEVVVNVSTIGGIIRAGDLVTTSFVRGKGQRIDRDEGAYVMGFALEDMQLTGDSIMVNGKQVDLGKVPVALRIGPYVTKQGAAFVASSSIHGFAAFTGAQSDESGESIDYFKYFRYVLGSLVAIGSVVLATRRFGDAFSQSVISVGRNPLAQSRIRSMLIWNTLLIVIISCIGLGVGAAIILAP